MVKFTHFQFTVLSLLVVLDICTWMVVAILYSYLIF